MSMPEVAVPKVAVPDVAGPQVAGLEEPGRRGVPVSATEPVAQIDPVAQSETLRAEVADLADVIVRARSEIAALEASGAKGCHIPAATDELGAIVEHTAAATDAILEACEALDRTARSLDPASSDAVQAATARIYEACSFQDIVGQRISKVVATLRMIDEKVAHLKGMLGDRPPRVREIDAMDAYEARSYEQMVLLNGPQLVATAMAQSEVDRLLADMA